MTQWEKDERSAKSLLTQKLPDSTLMKVHMKPTVHARWEAVVTEYTQKGAYAQTDLRAKFLASRCPEKGNVREFLDELRTKKEELVQVGVEIDEKDYLSTIISSLPFSLSNFASAQLAAARMFAPTKTIEPDVLLALMTEEADRQKAQYARRASRQGKDDGEVPRNEVMSAEGSKPKKGKGRENVTCWNCGQKGHYSNECKEPPKTEKPKNEGQKSPPENQAPTTNVAATIEVNAEEDGCWAAIEIAPDIPDWFEEVVTEITREFEDSTPHACSTMTWRNHAIDEQPDEPTRPLDDPKGGENKNVVRSHETPHNETTWPSQAPEPLVIEWKTCKPNVLVPRFEGENKDRCETRDLPEVPIPGTAAPDPLSISIPLDPEHVAKSPPCVGNLFEDHEVFLKGPGAAQDT